MEWNEEMDRQLIDLRSKGLSFTQVAKALGITRNAAQGRLNRLAGIKHPSDIARAGLSMADRAKLTAARSIEKEKIKKKLELQVSADTAAGLFRATIIARAREQCGASDRLIAKAMGVSTSLVCQIRSGYTPSPETRAAANRRRKILYYKRKAERDLAAPSNPVETMRPDRRT